MQAMADAETVSDAGQVASVVKTSLTGKSLVRCRIKEWNEFKSSDNACDEKLATYSAVWVCLLVSESGEINAVKLSVALTCTFCNGNPGAEEWTCLDPF